MPNVLIPLAEGFEEIEAVAVVDVLRRAGIGVTLAGLKPGPVTSSRKVVVLPDSTIDETDPGRFDMIVLPGGQPGTDNLNGDPRIHALLTAFSAAEKPVGAICAAPTVLATAGLLRNKSATCHPGSRDKLYGAHYVDRAVVRDGTVITSQGAGTAVSFGLAIVAHLLGATAADEIAAAMIVRDDHHRL